MSFLLPSAAPQSALADLDRACIAGGYDNMPAPTQVVRDAGRLKLLRDVDESGYLVVPWEVGDVGRLMGSSATLIERSNPYQFAAELARGKLHQLRSQAADWTMYGLQTSEVLEELMREASRRFGRSVTTPPSPGAEADALAALDLAYKAANQLVGDYTAQMFAARHQRHARLETTLGCRLNGEVPPAAAEPFAAAFNGAVLPFAWKSIEPTESSYRWEQADAMLEWALGRNLRVAAGPLIDFSAHGLPDWLWLWEGDLPSLSSFMCDYVETVVGRYRRHVRRWHLTAGSNNATLLKLGEDDRLWLTARLAEAALQVDSELELVIGVAQPWGEYMARAEHTYSPFIFADTLIRAGLKLAALDVEMVMGVSPRGSYCRDLLDASRILDLYTLLGTPIQATLAYPSSGDKDPLADPTLTASAGRWLSGFSPEVQAEWATAFASLALCKPLVRSVIWAQLNDAEGHQFPHCGLLDTAAQPKPALSRLQALREEHLR